MDFYIFGWLVILFLIFLVIRELTKKCGANNVPGLFGASSKKRKHRHY